MINRRNLLIFILLIMVESYIDPDIIKCPNWSGRLLLLSHHVLSVYLVLGSLLLGSPITHVIVNFVVILVWFKYKRCITTIYNNRLCNFDDSYTFKNFFYHLRKICNANHYLKEGFLFNILCILLFDLYLIYRRNELMKFEDLSELYYSDYI
jgi:hypothetical protein